MINTIQTTLKGWPNIEGVMPYGHSHLWQPEMLFWLNTLLDGMAGTSYFVIPLATILFMKKRRGLQKVKPVFWLFVAFILSCGITHIMEMYTIWQPSYRVSGWQKVSNAAISVAAAIAILPFLPRLLKNLSTSSLKQANNELQKQVEERERAERELQLHKDNLEVLVKNRTKDLEDTLLQLKCEARDRQRAQKQVTFQASMLDQLDSSIIAADTNGKIVYWNQYAERLFGWTREEALGKKTSELLIPKSGQLANEIRHQDFIKKEHWEGEITMRHSNGKTFPVHVSAAALTNEEGESVGYSLVCFNMTDHVRIASRLRLDKEKAERAALAKQDFLSTMSHEIRTPLNVVINMTRLLMDEGPREDQLEYMKSLQFSANHLLVIINDILDFAKIDAGKIKLEKINFSPREVSEGIIKAFKFRAEEKNISVRSDWDDTIPEYVLGDEVRLTQILNNLVGNAIKFTARGFVSVHAELLSKKKNQCKIKFDVRDTGIGIPADQLKSIFQDYTQGSDDTTRKFGGTGLGLTICKRLVDIQGGELSVRSKEGLGSSFSFILTYEHSAKITKESQQARQSVDTEKLKGINLLLVEDNPSNRMVATSFLQKVGIQVATAEHGRQAVEKVQKDTFDIVLMDLQMPIMSGCDAASAIRNLGDDYKDLPIIALTADVVQGVKDRVMDCGMSDYLSKPFNPDELHYKIALNMGLISSDEVPFTPSEEEDDMMQLHRLIDQYNDDVKFVTNLLDSLRRSFQLLTEQVANSANQKDVYELRRLTHKLLPSIKMVGNQELHTHLTELKEALDQDSVDETEINQFVDEIRKSTTESIEYIDELVITMQDHKKHLTSHE